MHNTDLTETYIDIWKTIFFHLVRYILLIVQPILEQAIIWLLCLTAPRLCLNTDLTDKFGNLESNICHLVKYALIFGEIIAIRFSGALLSLIWKGQSFGFNLLLHRLDFAVIITYQYRD